MYKGRNPAGEAAYVCSRIEQMIKEEGMRYRDAAVITGDLPSYGRELAHQFDEAGIPYFLDDKKSILEKSHGGADTGSVRDGEGFLL